MNGNQFDALSKRLASPQSRRTALKALTALAAGSLSGIFAGHASQASAQTTLGCGGAGEHCCSISVANNSFCTGSGIACQSNRMCVACGSAGNTCCSNTGSYLFEGNPGTCSGGIGPVGTTRGYVTVSNLGGTLVANVSLEHALPNTTYHVNLRCKVCNQGTVKTDGFGNGTGQVFFLGQGNVAGIFAIDMQSYPGCGSVPSGGDTIGSGPLVLGGCSGGATCQSGTCSCSSGTVLSGGACVACGGAGQPCCSGNTCTASGSTCINGSCCLSEGTSLDPYGGCNETTFSLCCPKPAGPRRCSNPQNVCG